MEKCKYYGGTAPLAADDNSGRYIICSQMPDGKTFYPFSDDTGKEQNHKCWSAGENCPFLQRKDNEDMKVQEMLEEQQQTMMDETSTPATVKAANTTLSAKQTEALSLHRKILADGAIAAESLTALAKDLKEMRDSKLYLELGHTNFEDYCEKSAGIKQRQAYNFIKSLETFGEDGLQSNASLGITKLAALATLCDADRAELMNSEDVSELSTRELQARIDDLQHKYDQQTLDFTALAAEKEELSEKIEGENSLKESLNDALNKIKELESRPVDVAVQEMSEEDKAKLRAEIAAELAHEAGKDLKAAEDKAKKEIEQAKMNSKKLADDALAEKKAAEAAKKAAEEKAAALEKEIADLQANAKKAATAPPPSEKKEVLKYHFEAIKNAFNASAEIISALEGEEKGKFKGAMLKLTDACKAIVEGIEV